MRLRLHTDYALRVLIYLAVRPGERTRVRDIAAAYDVSHHHLTKVVQRLQRGGWLATARGQGGGISLCIPPEQINVGTLVRELESAGGLVSCLDPDGDCIITPACGLKGAFEEALEAFMAVLDGYSLADLTGGRRRRPLLALLSLRPGA